MADTSPSRRGRGRPRLTTSEQSGGTVQALDKGIQLLQALGRESFVTLTDLSMQIGMSTSTAHRLLTTLEKHGFADFDDCSKEWSIGIEAFRVGSAYLNRTSLVETSYNSLRKLMEDTGETANLAIAEGNDIVFISQVETHHPIRAFFPPGSRGHMHASGIGKSLLANMPRRQVESIIKIKGCPQFTEKTLTLPAKLFENLELTKTRGWALDDEERYSGMRCIAASIFNSHGEAIAGISVSGPAVRFPDQSLSMIGRQVRQAAQKISSLIGGKARHNDDDSDAEHY